MIDVASSTARQEGPPCWGEGGQGAPAGEPGGRSGGDSRVYRRHRAERGQEALCDGGPGGDVPGGLAGDVVRVWGTWTGGELQADEQREGTLMFRPRSWAGVEPGRGGETQMPPTPHPKAALCPPGLTGSQVPRARPRAAVASRVFCAIWSICSGEQRPPQGRAS